MLTLLSLVFSPAALAAADLTTTITAPAGVYVYDSATWSVRVQNGGNQTASNATVLIQLPVTNTSPTVHVMGDLGAYSSTCTASGTTLSCNLGSIRRSRSVTVTFAIALPEAAQALVVTATAATSSSENSTANNGASSTATLLNDNVSFTPARTVSNSHCTGTALTSYFECELYPSSISSHDAVLEANGTITFPDYPDYGGTWSQPTADTLSFTYTELGTVVATFTGGGVSASCWEGLTTFPNSTYVSPYQVCLQ